jgi:hypothetical protein
MQVYWNLTVVDTNMTYHGTYNTTLVLSYLSATGAMMFEYSENLLSGEPDCYQTSAPTGEPSGQPSGEPTSSQPSAQPTSSMPSGEPSGEPTGQPTLEAGEVEVYMQAQYGDSWGGATFSISRNGEIGDLYSGFPEAGSNPLTIAYTPVASDDYTFLASLPGGEPKNFDPRDYQCQMYWNLTLPRTGKVYHGSYGTQLVLAYTRATDAWDIVTISEEVFGEPVCDPSSAPSGEPTSSQPSAMPTVSPTAVPSSAIPSAEPSAEPSAAPSAAPSVAPSTAVPSAQPSAQPSANPTGKPSSKPSAKPTRRPSSKPSAQPSAIPTVSPFAVPSSNYTNSSGIRVFMKGVYKDVWDNVELMIESPNDLNFFSDFPSTGNNPKEALLFPSVNGMYLVSALLASARGRVTVSNVTDDDLLCNVRIT